MKIITLLTPLLIAGCSAIQLSPQAAHIEIVNEVPDKKTCIFLGKIVGSQGNFLTGRYTSNKNLMLGARNELRNKASKLGGNIVYIQDIKTSNDWWVLLSGARSERINTAAIGKAYKCKK